MVRKVFNNIKSAIMVKVFHIIEKSGLMSHRKKLDKAMVIEPNKIYKCRLPNRLERVWSEICPMIGSLTASQNTLRLTTRPIMLPGILRITVE